MATMTLNVNGQTRSVQAQPEMPLLWALRDLLNLTGTKFGCGIGLCGACTVIVDGQAQRSCSTPVSAATGKTIMTIEGVSRDGSNPVQQAWLAESVSQCGYCQVGQIMTTIALLSKTPRPTDADIDAAFDTSLCRCGTYQRIRRAVHRAAGGN